MAVASPSNSSSRPVDQAPLSSDFDRVIEDPLARWSMRYKRELVALLVAALVAAWGWSMYTSSTQQIKEDATQTILNLQAAYDEVVAAKQKDAAESTDATKAALADAQKKAQGMLTALQDTGSAYAGWLALYQGLLHGSVDAASDTQKNDLAELAKVVVAKRKLDTDESAGVSELQSIVSQSSSAVAATVAYQTLATVLLDETVRLKALETLQSRFPAAAAVVNKR